MNIPKIFESEYRFCEILWENEPISSTELVRLCAEQLEWKKSTTYTVIRRLSERGVIKSEDAIVTSLVSREEAQSAESKEVVERTFNGSLPQFIAAFTRQQNLTESELDKIQKMIDDYRREQHE
ncbi:MAG: BlaI/MecI/CopY family transcriptional regulator [Lachnospiraceae bacterium]|nr:BlaI/MecI/CopY family transcriptional regulator [Lachnospiraceae bacterium]